LFFGRRAIWVSNDGLDEADTMGREEGGREGGREGGEGGREEGSTFLLLISAEETLKKGGREGGREGGRQGRRAYLSPPGIDQADARRGGGLATASPCETAAAAAAASWEGRQGRRKRRWRGRGALLGCRCLREGGMEGGRE